MSALLVSGQHDNNTSATTSVTATFPATPKQYNMLIAVVMGVTSSGSAIAITGWSLVATAFYNNSGQRVSLFTKVAGASESTTVTATLTSATVMHITISEWSGLHTTFPTDRTATDGLNSTTQVASRTSGTTDVTRFENTFAFAAWGFGGTLSGLSWTNGFTSGVPTSTRIRLAQKNGIPINTTVETTASWLGTSGGGNDRTAGGLVVVFRTLVVDHWGGILI